MLWVFDATQRFCGIKSGDRFFFSFGRSQHIKSCTKPVYLDFGEFIVQVQTMTDVFPRFAGFGYVRDRSWFVNQFLSERQRQIPIHPPQTIDDITGIARPVKQPWRLTSHPSNWLGADGQECHTVPQKTPYIPLDYYWLDPQKNTKRPVWSAIIDQLPEIANGWTDATFIDMITFLSGTPMILGGLLRLMPPHAAQIVVKNNLNRVRQLLRELDNHMRAGRVAVIRESTRSLLLERAKMMDCPAIG